MMDIPNTNTPLVIEEFINYELSINNFKTTTENTSQVDFSDPLESIKLTCKEQTALFLNLPYNKFNKKIIRLLPLDDNSPLFILSYDNIDSEKH